MSVGRRVAWDVKGLGSWRRLLGCLPARVDVRAHVAAFEQRFVCGCLGFVLGRGSGRWGAVATERCLPACVRVCHACRVVALRVCAQLERQVVWLAWVLGLVGAQAQTSQRRSCFRGLATWVEH